MKPPATPNGPAGNGARIPPPEAATAAGDAATSLPWPTTWRGVYLFVLGLFILWVALLAALTEAFS